MSDLFVAIDQGFSACYGPTSVEGHPFLRLKRSLQLLNAILKELASVKIPSGLKVFGTVDETHSTRATPLTSEQIIGQGHVVLFNYYSNMAPILTASLVPENIGLPRTSEGITIAHVTYKCLTKLAVHVWHRLPRGDCIEHRPWVSRIVSQKAKHVVLTRRIPA